MYKNQRVVPNVKTFKNYLYKNFFKQAGCCLRAFMQVTWNNFFQFSLFLFKRSPVQNAMSLKIMILLEKVCKWKNLESIYQLEMRKKYFKVYSTFIYLSLEVYTR